MGQDYDKIRNTIREMNKEVEMIESQIVDICYYMKGGITWNDAWMLSPRQREKIVKSLSKKLQQEQGIKKEYM